MRFIFLLVLLATLVAAPLLAGQAHAEPFAAGQTLDQHVLAEVTGTALAFMAPRTLEPHSAAQLTIWGLRGLTALDPRLVAELSPQALRLSLSGHVVASRPPPPLDADSQVWAEAAAQVMRQAWDLSDLVRAHGSQGVLRGFFDELFNHLDPYSRYASPQDAAEERGRRDGRAGIGIDVAAAANATRFTVRAVAPASPAAAAGIRPGDTLLGIDGVRLDGAELPAVLALLAGPEGTTVSLQLRTAARPVRTIDLQRVVITPPTVFAQALGDVLVLRISGFARDTASLLAREIGKASAEPGPHRSKVQGLVLDLRGNRGGLLRQAVSAAETLVPQGVIAVTAGRDPDASHEYRADGADLWHGMPVVILVDGRTASAAEVLAAALSDQRLAVVVGSATLGKGLVQTILPLPDGGAMSLTWSRVLAPLGWPLQALGVLPQVCTSLGDAALKHALAELAQGHQPMAQALTRHREARAPMPPAQILEIRNACPASEGRDADLAAARFLIEQPVAYAAALIPLPIAP